MSKIGPHSSDRRAVRGLSITIGGATLILSQPIMGSPPARSAHQLEFRLHDFESFALVISGYTATIELEVAFSGVQAEPMGYLYQQIEKPSGLFPLHPSAGK
jgi:hypothetical protein